jgi:hypothetical protein
MPSPDQPRPLAPVRHFHETTDDVSARHRYSVIRFYRRGEDTFRITIERDSYEQQSTAIAEVLTTSREWSRVVGNAPSNWHDTTSLYATKGTGAHPEPGFTTLRRLADALAAEAMTIVPG